MALSTYAELQTSIAAWSYRTDLATIIPDFIALTESDMQIRCKLMEFESSVTLNVVAGIAAIPADFKGHRAAYLNGNQKTPLRYVTPERFDVVSNNSGPGLWFTITDDTFKMAPMSDGTVVLTYHAKFTPLSGTNASNSILANYPDAYLYGSLIQMARYTKDTEAMQTTMPMYEAVIQRINKDNQDRKYPGPLVVRPA
jgi:hypothetical protein